MSLVFAAIAPHPPILIPSIGKKNLEEVKKTKAALEELEKELYVRSPDYLVVISPHGQLLADAFTINMAPKFEANFEQFGDFSTKMEFKSDFMLSQEIRAQDEAQKSVPLALISEGNIDHGVSVPLYYLTQHLKEIPIIPIGFSMLDLQTHYHFGEFLHNQISRVNKRVAVIASGDLSHCLTEDAPGGYSKEGKIFDEKIIELLKKKDKDGILNLDQNLIDGAGECGLRSIVILLGILKDIDYQPEVLSYEGPFGVGYLVANMKFN